MSEADLQPATTGRVSATYFSDVLCIWAYIAELRIDEVEARFGAQVGIERRFCNVFGDTVAKIRTVWKDKGGYDGFNHHLRGIAEGFPEIAISDRLWLDVRPTSSASPHLFLKAVELAEKAGDAEPGAAAHAVRAMRGAFFRQARDVSCIDVQTQVGEESGLDVARIQRLIRSGAAFAALASDYQEADTLKIQGSPTLLLNEGRQKLYGNVGYRIIEANIQELLREPMSGQASWC